MSCVQREKCQTLPKHDDQIQDGHDLRLRLLKIGLTWHPDLCQFVRQYGQIKDAGAAPPSVRNMVFSWEIRGLPPTEAGQRKHATTGQELAYC